MKKKYLGPLALSLALLPTQVWALEISPYISNKLSFSKNYSKNNEIRYVGADTKPTEGTDDDDAFGDKIAVGMETALPSGKLRTELEIGLNTKVRTISKAKGYEEEVTKAETDNITYMLNAYYDFNTGTKFTPYFGFGLGIANINSKIKYDSVALEGQNTRGDTETNNFAYNLGIGIGYAVNERISVDFGYRYTDFGTVEEPAKYTEGVIGKEGVSFKESYVLTHSKFSAQEVLLGIRYSF
jgi:opacity protein-like surface antigen